MEVILWATVLATATVCVVIACRLLLRSKTKGLGPGESCQHIIMAPLHFDGESEVVVVGSGVLGSAMAAVMARDGHRVTVIERDLSEPDRIVGEVLQPGGYRALRMLDLEDAVKGIDAHVVHGYVVHDNDSNTSVQLTYPRDGHQRVITGRSFHHGRFVMKLRGAASKAGATLVEGTVLSLLEDKDGHIVGVEYKDKKTGDTKTMKANLTVVADGCFSRFRKGLIRSPVSVSSHFMGIVMHNCPQFEPGHAEIVLSNTGPILIYQISSNATRILIDIQGNKPQNPKEYLQNCITSQLPEHIQGPFEAALRDERIRSMPNSFLPSSVISKPGVLLLGDAFNMRHPLTGAGMSAALNDILIWRELLSTVPDLADHKRLQQCLKTFQWKRKASHSFVINVLAQALYALFSASDQYLHDLRRACFQYFKLGGMAVSGPVGLLSVLRPHPLILVGHFFAVALYAIYQTVKTQSVLTIHRGVHRAMMIFIKACSVIFPLIGSEFVTLLS